MLFYEAFFILCLNYHKIHQTGIALCLYVYRL